MSSIQLPAKIENMELLVQFISDIARKLGFSGKRVKEIELATEEALVNIINYAYPDHSGNIKVTCSQDPSNDYYNDSYNDSHKAFVIKIEDTGIAFDVMSLKDPDISTGISDREVGGLGVFLIRKLMDKVLYHRKNKKNILELVVNIPAK